MNNNELVKKIGKGYNPNYEEINNANKFFEIIFPAEYRPLEGLKRPTEKEVIDFYRYVINVKGETIVDQILQFNKVKLDKKRTAIIESSILEICTIENAMRFNLYREIIFKTSKALIGTPKNFSKIMKAKILRMYIIVFANVWYFPEDYSQAQYDVFQPNWQRVKSNNSKYCRPEQIFYLYKMYFQNNNFYYPEIKRQFDKLDQELQQKISNIFGLTYENGEFKDLKDQKSIKFKEIRELKKKVYPEFLGLPYEMFSNRQCINYSNLEWLIIIYKKLTFEGYDRLPIGNWEIEELVKNEIQKHYLLGKKIGDGLGVFSKEEAENFITGFHNMQNYRVCLYLKKEDGTTRRYSSKTFIGALLYAMYYLKNVTRISTIEEDIKSINSIIYKARILGKTDQLRNYKKGDNLELGIQKSESFVNIFIEYFKEYLQNGELDPQKVEEYLDNNIERLKAIKKYIETGNMDLKAFDMILSPIFVLNYLKKD